MTLLAHIGGVPVEETLGTLGPAAMALIGLSTACVRSAFGRRRRPDEDDA